MVAGSERGGRAGDEDGFAQRDDDEQRAALGHVRAVHFPVRGVRAAEPGHEVADERPADFERERDDPRPPRARTLPAMPPAIQNTADTASQAVMR